MTRPASRGKIAANARRERGVNSGRNIAGSMLPDVGILKPRAWDAEACNARNARSRRRGGVSRVSPAHPSHGALETLPYAPPHVRGDLGDDPRSDGEAKHVDVKP